jgi:hypothetical protein
VTKWYILTLSNIDYSLEARRERERERERKREGEVEGGIAGGITFDGERKRKLPNIKVPRQCPLVLLA